jgi:hypothetical protein
MGWAKLVEYRLEAAFAILTAGDRLHNISTKTLREFRQVYK